MVPREKARIFFEKLFTVNERRTVLLCRWLCILPVVKNKTTTPVDIFEHWIRAITTDKPQFTVEKHGLHINDKMTLPNEILLSTEIQTIHEMQKEKRTYFSKDGTFLFNDVVFTAVQRQLLCRDFVNIVMLKYTRHNCARWPLYALHAVQRIVSSMNYFNAPLFDMHHMLQGMGKSHAMPIHEMRQGYPDEK